jgi:hypothetical protein
MNGHGETINNVIDTYDEWKREKEEEDLLNRQRQAEVSNQINNMLGEDLFSDLKKNSSDLLNKSNTGILVLDDSDVLAYVKDSVKLFRKASIAQNFPLRDAEALDLLSSIVAFLPDESLREQILTVLSKQIRSCATAPTRIKDNNPLPALVDSDLTESFVRGSGAGGQKINKTANKVILVHTPTQIRVECQETRSLQQNRKIARKRMQFKLDEHFNGSDSKIIQKVAKKVNKKARSKARNKARRQKKEGAKGK